MVDGGERAEAFGQALGLDGVAVAFADFERRHDEFLVACAEFFRQQLDERVVEVVLPGFRQQFGGRAGIEDLAVVHGDQPVEALGFVHVGGRHDHAHVLLGFVDGVDQVPELAACERVDAGGRFVEHKQVGVVDQRAAEAELLLHAAGKLACRTVEEGIEAGAFCQAVDPAAALGGVMTEEAREELEVFLDREREIQVFTESLGHVGDLRADLVPVVPVAHVAAEDAQIAFLHGVRPGYEGQQGGFAHAVGADHADHLARGDIERDMVERQGLAVFQSQVLKTDDRFDVHALIGG